MKYLILLLPCVVACATPWYNFMEPRMYGFPFFYWFNLALIPFSSLCIYIASKVGGAND